MLLFLYYLQKIYIKENDINLPRRKNKVRKPKFQVPFASAYIGHASTTKRQVIKTYCWMEWTIGTSRFNGLYVVSKMALKEKKKKQKQQQGTA